MIRLASIFALACLAVAATALLTAPKSFAGEQLEKENGGNAEAGNRLLGLTAERTVSFHARFSLN